MWAAEAAQKELPVVPLHLWEAVSVQSSYWEVVAVAGLQWLKSCFRIDR